jgi:hypothetical protein
MAECRSINQQSLHAMAGSFLSRLLVASLYFAAIGGAVRADDAPEPNIAWKSGPTLTKALQASVGFSWTERPLGEGLAALSRDTEVAILLDRRIDPSQRITFSARNMALSDALKELARAQELSVGMAGAVVYLGPPGRAGKLQGLSGLRRRELSAELRATWLERRPMQWEELAEPRDLVQAIALATGAEVKNPAAMPHDVWPAWRGPSVSAVDQLSLLLAGFDLTFAISDDGRSVSIVPAPDSFVYEQSYPIRGDAAKVIADLQRILPEAKVRRQGAGQVVAEATADDHAKISELLAGNRVTTRTVTRHGEKRYTLTVENQPLGAIVKTIAAELEVEVKAEANLAEALAQRTSLQVRQVTAEELLAKVLDEAGIRFTLTDGTLELRAK